MKVVSIACSLVLFASAAQSDPTPGLTFDASGPLGQGWEGFLDLAFMANALMMLSLAAILGAALAYRPNHTQDVDTLEEIQAPSVYTTYAVIGALIGIMVVEFGLVVGFVLFGIGGLIRFRTVMGSVTQTSQIIIVTLIGLSCGLNLPHVAVLVTAFGFALVCVFKSRITYRINIRELPPEHVIESASAYREMLEQQGCRILSEKKCPRKGSVTFIFRSAHRLESQKLTDVLKTRIDAPFMGSVDLQVR